MRKRLWSRKAGKNDKDWIIEYFTPDQVFYLKKMKLTHDCTLLMERMNQEISHRAKRKWFSWKIPLENLIEVFLWKFWENIIIKQELKTLTIRFQGHIYKRSLTVFPRIVLMRVAFGFFCVIFASLEKQNRGYVLGEDCRFEFLKIALRNNTSKYLDLVAKI